MVNHADDGGRLDQGCGRDLDQGRAAKAALELKTTTGNKRRQLTAEILQNQWQQAGFQLTVTPETAGCAVRQGLPGGNFQIGLYAQTPTDNDPGQCELWCSQEHPWAVNGNAAQNYDRISDPTLDTALEGGRRQPGRRTSGSASPRQGQARWPTWSRRSRSIRFPTSS